MRPELGFEIRLDLTYDEAIFRTVEALKVEGFGVLTKIHMRTTMREKLNVEFRPYTILGACNPPLAHRALSENPDAGLFLPCNVTVMEDNAQVVVKAVNPVVMLGPLGDDPALHAIAEEAGNKLRRVIASLEQ